MTARLEAADGGSLRLCGPLTFVTVGALWARETLRIARAEAVELDLSTVERTDSAGLALLVGWSRQARRAGGSLILRRPPEQLLAFARVSGVEGALGLDGDDSPR